VLVTLAAGCSEDQGGHPSASADPPAQATSGASPAKAVEGGWVREATEDRARELGVPTRTIARYVGNDGVLPVGFMLRQQTYAIYVIDDAGKPSLYDIGGYYYDEQGRLALSSSSTRCSDCDTALGWRQDGPNMVIDEVSGPRATPLDRLVWEGAWVVG
jgi:hypothetical protein